MAGKAKIEKVTMVVPCRVFGCGKKASYKIGNPAGSPSGFYFLCGDCTESLLKSISEVFDDNKEVNVDNNEVIAEVEEEEVATEEVEVHYVWSEAPEEPIPPKEEPVEEVVEPKKATSKKALAKRGTKK